MLLLVFERPSVRLQAGDGLLTVRGIQALCWPHVQPVSIGDEPDVTLEQPPAAAAAKRRGGPILPSARKVVRTSPEELRAAKESKLHPLLQKAKD